MSVVRIFQIAKELNISHTDILSFLNKKGVDVKSHMSPVDEEVKNLIMAEFSKDKMLVDRFRKEQVRKEIHDTRLKEKQESQKKLQLLSLQDQRKLEKKEKLDNDKGKIEAGKNKLDDHVDRSDKRSTSKAKAIKKKFTPTKKQKLRKINISNIQSEFSQSGSSKIEKDTKLKSAKVSKNVETKVKATLAALGTKKKKKVYKKAKSKIDETDENTEITKTIKIPEFSSVDELSKIFAVSSSDIIAFCLELGTLATINQRLDWDVIELIANHFEFIAEKIEDATEELFSFEDSEEDLKNAISRSPVVTVMGHVDHGKTSLLDYIREENVIAGESGGITQHIGAYSVMLKDNQKITFLDTPGHEAFTAMRARGAQVTDIAIIVIAADDDIMPQTKEAISHAQAAGVPLIFAINKVDKPDANPDKIKEALAGMNLMVEEWGGKIQSQDISSLQGTGVNELLEKVLLEAELLELKANPNRKSKGTVVEAFLDKGRGYVSTMLVQTGTLKIGDYILAGKHSGKIKAMFNERGKNLESAPPSTPVSILGLDGAPQAGDNFHVLEDEKEAKQIAAKRTQLLREQNVRTQRHITLDEIGRRIALGEFKELNMILKGDVDGSVEALTDSLQKLSTEEIQVNIIHKGVGAITESDVLLASASDAIVLGFNVRPMGNARSIAEKEEIDIRSYSIIYDAINDVKDAMEGMLSPEMKEEITGTAEIRETYKISKVGTIAGCMVTTGKIFRNSGIRLIREGVVVFSGNLVSLKRFKDDVKEVAKGYDCGIQIKNFNDIKESDVLECFQEVAVKKKL